MNWIMKYFVRGIGYSLIFLLLYAAITLSLFIGSILIFKSGVALKNKLLNSYQSEFYYSGYRNIWQATDECIELDHKLIYKPRLGACQFKNPEFNTTLNFGPKGRRTLRQDGLKGIGIAVIGDSHAMGWGVEDEETFAAILERRLGKPVYNLAVSSYGTYRELIRLEQSGLIDSVDTVIIQYSYNDIKENLDYKNARLDAVYKEFNSARSLAGSSATFKFVSHMFRYALGEPIRIFKNMLTGVNEPLEDFSTHYAAFMKVVDEFSWLKNKKVIVIYVSSHGKAFANFPGKSSVNTQSKYLKFLDLNLSSVDFYVVDDHPTKYGHEIIAGKLFNAINGNF